MNTFTKFLKSSLFWWVVLLIPTLSMGIALYFQYVLYDEPCALCIHVRVYMVALMIIGLLGVIINSSLIKAVLHWLLAGVSVGLAFKCWELFGVERGFIAAGCSFDAGLPSWLPLEALIPSLFESRGSCGVSPDVAFGISMAESLMPVAIAAAIVAVLAAVVYSVAYIRGTETA